MKNLPLNNRVMGRKQTAKLPPVRMFSEEYQTVQNAAILAGKTLSEYVRSVLLADDAPKPSQSVTNPPQELTSLLPQTIPSVPSAPHLGYQVSNASETLSEKMMERQSVAENPRARKHAKAGFCPHGFRFVAGRTACSECKRK